ncbi:MAG: response regulator, partial [Candidatus Hydrogenedentes bacterium]|nr:response regulator [Candidatus Hydrogenedentota bacterium]
QLERVDMEKRYLRKDGSVVWARTTGVWLFDTEGKPLYAIAMLLDITDRKKAEAQVLQTQKLESLGALAGGIAHDFNNILMAILGNAGLALQDVSQVSPLRPMLEEIDAAAHRAADLCRQMLAYSGKGRFVVKAMDLSELVQEMGQMLEVSISKRTALRYNLCKSLPTIEADATQIRQVIMNLIINASEAMGDKDGMVSVTTGVMDCDQQYLQETRFHGEPRTGRHVYLEVTDTGCGMDAVTMEKIFDPFFTTKFTGRGLGLAAVLGIVRGHRGGLKVYSEVGKGTSFKILFPAVSGQAEAPCAESAADGLWRGHGTVLLVDDEAITRTVASRMLECLGFAVLIANDGRQGLEIFRECREQISCVLLDLTMPHMDGEEAFREMRRIKPGVRVIMSSGYNEQEVINRFVGKGIAGFIQKPYQLDNLAATLKSVLEKPDAGKQKSNGKTT